MAVVTQAQKELRVVHVINNLPVGGAERFLCLLAAEQARLGANVSVLTLVEPNPLAAALVSSGIPHRCMGRAALNDPRLGLDLVRHLRALRPDVVHTHLFYADTFGRPAARLAKVPAVVSTEHSTEGGAISWRRHAGMRWSARFADRVVAVSEAVRATTAARLGMSEARIDVVPNGIDLRVFAAAVPLERAALGIPTGAHVVGCVGRIMEAKGYDRLLEAVARLGRSDLRLLFVGDGPERDALRTRAQDLGIEAWISWLGVRDDVPSLLGTFDVFAAPSRWEGHSMALLEAMAAGCACLASDIPEIASTIGEAGLLVPGGDVEALAAGLAALLDAPERRRTLGSRARDAARRFSIETSAERYLEIYRETLARRGAGPGGARGAD